MADSTIDSCLNISNNDLPKRHKKKYCGYHYVPPESDEADTLKDRFWRDLEQGKLNFLNTVDMYTRVKRLGKLSDSSCLAARNHDPVLLTDTSPVTHLQSSVPLSSVTGSLVSAADASPPSSGYESSSIPSISSVSVTDSPTESDPHISTSYDLFTNVAQSQMPASQRKRKASNKCIWQSSFRPKYRKCHATPGVRLNRKKTTNSKFFRYVDASSEEADTLKDKFWRNLEMGNVSAITSTDLYSSVKVSRRTRQLSLSSVSNSDEAKNCTEVCVNSKESLVCETSDCLEVCDVGDKWSEAGDSSCNGKSGPYTSDQAHDCVNVSEPMTSITDCKLLSPCSVTVERLPFNIDDVDLLIAGSLEMCSSIITDNFDCTNAETSSKLITENDSIVHSSSSVNVGCKRYWHNGRCRTGLKPLNKDAAVQYISGTKTRVERIHLSSIQINTSLPVCCVPLAFPSTWQQRAICGWLEDDTGSKAGEVCVAFGWRYLQYII